MLRTCFEEIISSPRPKSKPISMSAVVAGVDNLPKTAAELTALAVEEMVIIELTAFAPEILIELGTAQVGTNCAPRGRFEVDKLQVTFTEPTNPPAGETVNVEVLLLVAPAAAMVAGVPVTTKGSVMERGTAMFAG